uniref:Uncharacterized protein n=1 Tax=Siphoviridae sp. ctDo63 TaxID=2823571 RepID=A0A8S5LG29_9CAUD|nr:MAG TPA: hypothetical protein [Siphoviridae sp. ctDo63]
MSKYNFDSSVSLILPPPPICLNRPDKPHPFSAACPAAWEV